MEEAISILVVDDEPDIRRICRILLETGGYTVLEAATGAEAVEQVRKHPELDLILMDMIYKVIRYEIGKQCDDDVLNPHFF